MFCWIKEEETEVRIESVKTCIEKEFGISQPHTGRTLVRQLHSETRTPEYRRKKAEVEKLTEDKKKNEIQHFKEERVEVSIKLKCSGIAAPNLCHWEEEEEGSCFFDASNISAVHSRTTVLMERRSGLGLFQSDHSMGKFRTLKITWVFQSPLIQDGCDLED